MADERESPNSLMDPYETALHETLELVIGFAQRAKDELAGEVPSQIQIRLNLLRLSLCTREALELFHAQKGIMG